MMLARVDNVAPLLRSPAQDRSLIRSHDAGLAKDLACLKELSLQLETARRLFARTADALNDLCSAKLQTNIAGVTDRYLKEVEALQIGANALISAMAAHQASA